MSTIKARCKSLLVVLALIMSTFTVSREMAAQAIFGSVYGQITDQSGGAIPGAIITVTDTAKGTSVKVSSNGSGEYTVDHLIPDDYDIKIEAPGFRAVTNHGVHVAADTSPKIDIKMDVGAARTRSSSSEISRACARRLEPQHASLCRRR